ncbi:MULTISPECIES: hypothetical protein [unclassified Pseudomonas]|uniref:hypothetical protein n=1 Tax=unclassified Pseudomonas TaxID=196821 RepID=UPI00128C65BE|nr:MULTISPECIES: hypothetical protein [unclassified Pseudomonas]MPQ68761.1 hypothetical protein [Pseudomonas sp. MWU12-2323]
MDIDHSLTNTNKPINNGEFITVYKHSNTLNKSSYEPASVAFNHCSFENAHSMDELAVNKTAEFNNRQDNKASQLKARNASRMAEISRPHFDGTYEKSLMGVSCRVFENRRIEIATRAREVIDYTRYGYLSLDSHPKVLAIALANFASVLQTYRC